MNMNEWEIKSRMAKVYKEMYPKGTRIELVDMEDIYSPIDPYTKGTVEFVDDIGQIHMRWDNGRTLALIPDKDVFRIIKEE